MNANITILDAATLTRENDIDLSVFEKFGNVTIHETTSPDQVAERITDAEVVLTNKVAIRSKELESAPKLKLINVCATGTDIIDIPAARDRGIAVCNVAGYSTESVAQHVFTLILNLSTGIHRYAQEAKQWPDSPIFTRLDHPINELNDKTLGIVGYGSIGQAVARIGRAFGMKVVAYSRNDSSSADKDVTRLGEDAFFSEADVISLHCPLNDSTRNFIDAERLNKMKPSALLINTGRGPLIDSQALVSALENQTIAGAGLDVLESEPPSADHPLLQKSYPNLIITPHTAWAATQARQRLIDGLVKNLESFNQGTRENRVD